MKKVSVLFPLIFMVLIFALSFLPRIKHKEELTDSFSKLRSGNVASYQKTKLKDGGSFTVIVDHDCCVGRGFDAVAIRTSDGKEYYSNKNYCGTGDFWHSAVGASETIAELSKNLKLEGFRKWPKD